MSYDPYAAYGAAAPADPYAGGYAAYGAPPPAAFGGYPGAAAYGAPPPAAYGAPGMEEVRCHKHAPHTQRPLEGISMLQSTPVVLWVSFVS